MDARESANAAARVEHNLLTEGVGRRWHREAHQNIRRAVDVDVVDKAEVHDVQAEFGIDDLPQSVDDATLHCSWTFDSWRFHRSRRCRGRLRTILSVSPLVPVFSKQFDRVRSALGAVAARQIIGGTIFVAAPADSFGVARMERGLHGARLGRASCKPEA
jgi:hypothetical protein